MTSPFGWSWQWMILVPMVPALISCASPAPAQRARVAEAPDTWHGAKGVSGLTLSQAPAQRQARWWNAMGDPTLDGLIRQAQRHNPSIVSALARTAEARAAVNQQRASAMPQASAAAEASRGNTASVNGETLSSAQVSLKLGWEIDLFGRLRYEGHAAQSRLEARESDAALALLTLEAQVATSWADALACGQRERFRGDDVRSREETLSLTRERVRVGQLAPAEAARARSSLADARNALQTTQAECAAYLNALVRLTGLAPSDLKAMLERRALVAGNHRSPPQPLVLALPARTLVEHPAIAAAARDADAAFDDLSATRAARWPTLDLSALLGNNWIRTGQGTTSSGLSSWGLSMGLAVFDGGRQTALIERDEARYVQALQSLRNTVLVQVEAVENALARLGSAEQRGQSAREGVDAASALLRASEASFGVGRSSLSDLEESRRTFNAAVLSQIAADLAQHQAWIDLVKATGGALAPPEPADAADPPRQP